MALLITALLLLGFNAGNATEPLEAKSELSADEARAIAKEAFIYGFPMVVNYKTMYQYSVGSVPSLVEILAQPPDLGFRARF